MIDETSSLNTITIPNFHDSMDIINAVCALLNSGGGRILVGIGKHGEVVGITLNREDSLRRLLMDKIVPRPRFSILSRKVGKKDIWLIDVPAGTESPYVVGETILVLQRGNVQSASLEAISGMILGRTDSSDRWEKQPNLQATLTDLSRREIEETYHSYLRREFREHEELMYETDGLDDRLKKLGLASGSNISNAAYVLFGETKNLMPQRKLRFAAFNSNDAEESLENRTLDLGLFELFSRVMNMISEYVPIASRFKGITREDSRQIPEFVVREALMNALVHRDYSDPEKMIQVGLFKDRLEIWNPGQLPEGVIGPRLASSRISLPHNPDIANIAFIRGLVEQWGSGTGRMVRECRKFGLIDPEWEEISGGVLVTIRMTQRKKRFSVDDLNTRVVRMLQETYPGEQFSLAEYMAHYSLNVSERTARRDLENLKEMGFINEVSERPLIFVRSDLEFT